MKRRLCALGLSVVLVHTAVAGEPPKKPKKSGLPSAPAATTASLPSASGRKQLEALLQSPAKLDFGDRKQVTVGEVLDRLHEQHHLSLRFDAPTLASLLGTPSGAAGGCPTANMVGGSYNMPGVILSSSNPPTPRCYAPSALGQAVCLDKDPNGSPLPAPPVSYATPSGPYAPGGRASSDLAVAPQAATASAAPAVAPAAARAYPALAIAPQTAQASVAPVAAPAASAPAFAAPAAPAPLNAYLPTVLSVGVPAPQAVASPANDPSPPLTADGTNPPANPQPSPSTAATPKAPAGIQEILTELLKIEIDVQSLDLTRASIATVLRHALDAAPTAGIEDFAGMPILFTNAMLLDYLIEDHGLLITTRMKALTSKETRVYSISKSLQDLPAEDLAKTIRHSIRPWSWRSQINDLGDQLKGSPLPAEMLTSIVKTGVQLVGAEVGMSVTPTSADEGAGEAKKSSAEEARQMEMLGNAIANGLVTLAQATVSALEMVHYAEPPTGTVQILGTKLIITQSQAAHREIAELLKQLEEE